MNKPSKCKNCQWYGKPYWSIINPCDNCPMENIETFTVWQDPTIEEKDKEIERLNKEKDDLDDYNRYLHNENKRLNNIINELEKWLEEQREFIQTIDMMPNLKEIKLEHKIMFNDYNNVLDKLKELKENKDIELDILKALNTDLDDDVEMG